MQEDVLCQSKEKLMFTRIREWVKGLVSEISWWDTVLYKVKYCDDTRKDRLVPRDFVYEFNSDIVFEENDIIVDIGSGPLPVYGNRIRGKHVNYLPMDPLAFEYKKLYDKYGIKLPVEPSFAFLEGLSGYIHQKADYVICSNAMDHSIDPLCSLIECIKATKIGGSVLLAHLEEEAEYANYTGLHQWNITIRNDKLIFFNREYEFDVSQILNDYCNVELRHVAGKEGRYWNVARIIKMHDINGEVPVLCPPDFYTSTVVLCLMEFLAGRNTLYLPSGDERLPSDKHFIIFGRGNGGIRALAYFGKKKKQIRYFIDNSVSDVSMTWQGFQVRNPSLLEKNDDDIILIASTAYSDAMQKQLIEMGFLHGTDFLLFDEFTQALSHCPIDI